MKTRRRAPSTWIAVAGALGVALWLTAEAREGTPGSSAITICRHQDADGRTSDHVDLERIERRYRTTWDDTRGALRKIRERVSQVEMKGYSAGVTRSRTSRRRTVRLKDPVPARFRRYTLFFVRVPRGGGRPRLLPRMLSVRSAVFALEADSLKDVERLSKTLGRRVTLAGRDLALALGVRAVDSRVTFGSEGKSATIEESAP